MYTGLTLIQSCSRSKSLSIHNSGIWVLKDNCSVYKKTDSDTQPRHEPIFSVSFSFSRSFILQAQSHIPTFCHHSIFKKSYKFCLVVLLESLKHSRRPMTMVQYGIITYIRCLDIADYHHQCGRRNSGCASTITHDLKPIITQWTNKAVSPCQNCSYYRCTI